MDDVLEYGDIVQQYQGNIVLYKGTPVLITGVSAEPGNAIRFTNLVTQKNGTAKFSMKDFTPPNMRIGMVNVCGATVFAERKPVRKMNVGINTGNLIVSTLRLEYPEGRDTTQNEVLRLRGPELAQAMLGIYPSFEECLAHVKEFKGSMAFDRQFCIDGERNIHYKQFIVGSLPKNCTKVERISFAPDFEHLELLIGDNCGRTLQAVG